MRISIQQVDVYVPTYKKTSPIGLVLHFGLRRERDSLAHFLRVSFETNWVEIRAPVRGCEKALSFSRKRKGAPFGTPFFLAEREGFEPPEPLSSTVFKTAAIDHSAISPRRNWLARRNSPCEFGLPPLLLLTRAHEALVIFS